ncbi:MAG: ABC transporter ATP-binding protein [Eubacteriaceae bacterium]|nr:ABC transporter ATP-binding protein [Eubacteriaceae bacterium]
MFFAIKNLNVFYGVIHALKDISINVDEGEVVTLIGSNGAGKTSTLRAISSLVKIKSGEIIFKDKNITGGRAADIVKMGISHVPEGRRIFPDMTVAENLSMGAYLRKDKAGIKQDLEMVFDRFPILKQREKQLGGTLSGGEQQMLTMGRALMSKPKLMLLDEPSMGLSPIYVQQIFSIIKDINKTGTTILLVEQNANMALHLAQRAYILETGNIVKSGKAEELLNSDDVRNAYLGGK